MRRAITLVALLTASSLAGPEFALASMQYRVPPANSSARDLPPGWIGLFDGTGHCRYAVPPSWPIDDRYSRNAFAMSPDRSVIVHQGWMPVMNWTDFVANAVRSLQPGRTLASSAGELRIEHPTGEADSQRYIALRAGAGVCVGTIDVKMSVSAPTLAVASQVERTISVVK